jgi:MFS transporter, DHA1 family, tetracycline resistance protein
VRGAVILKLLPILGITFVDILGFSIMLPLLPFFVKHFGESDVVVGGVLATYSLFQLIGGPLWGTLSDRIGRKAVLIVSQIGATIAWAMLGFAPSIVWVFLSRALEGFSGGNFGVTQAYVGDLVEPKRRGEAFAYVGAAFSAGFVFGPALGGWLTKAFGYGVPFLVAAGLQVLTLVLTIALLPESRSRQDETKSPVGLAAIFTSLADEQISPVLWLRLVYVLGLYGWFGAMALVFNRQLGWGVVETSYVFAAFGVLQVVLQIAIVGRIVERLGNRLATTLGLALCTLAFVLVPFATRVPLMVAVLLAFGIGLSIENAAYPTLASEVSPDDRRGTVLGVVSGLDSLAGFLMPPIVTAVLGAFGVAPAAAIVAALVGIATVMGIVQARGAMAPRVPLPKPR